MAADKIITHIYTISKIGNFVIDSSEIFRLSPNLVKTIYLTKYSIKFADQLIPFINFNISSIQKYFVETYLINSVTTS